MKKIILLITLVLSSALYKAANAQVGINVNIGSQPVWGPSGYDYAEYYYFPDMDVYYHVPDRQFVYCDRGNWISAYSLPSFYNNYDLYNSYKVVINEPRPFARNDYWHSRYFGYRGHKQDIIYNSRDPRYFVINEHPEHARYMAGRQNNSTVYNNNRPGNFGRTEDRRFDDRRNDDRRFDDRRNDDRRFDDHRFDNNQRTYDMSRNDRGGNDHNYNDDFGRMNDNRRGNGNDQRGNGGFNGGRRN